MKFCKNLQRLVEISDPEWTAYWPNYKLLKKLIKKLPSLIPLDEENKKKPLNNLTVPIGVTGHNEKKDAEIKSQKRKRTCSEEEKFEDTLKQQNSEKKARKESLESSELKNLIEKESVFQARAKIIDKLFSSTTTTTNAININKFSSTSPSSKTSKERLAEEITGAYIQSSSPDPLKTIQEVPAEVKFFKVLHSELRKAVHFYDKVEQEFESREERIREGVEILKKYDRVTLKEDCRGSVAKSIYRLYKDLLLLETYAIMTYCSFSKILKKHDKITGYNTRNAFISNLVNRANFSSYPKLISMINRCEKLYEEVQTEFLLPSSINSNSFIAEDERLFIDVVKRLKANVMDVANEEGAPIPSERKYKHWQSTLASSLSAMSSNSSISTKQEHLLSLTQEQLVFIDYKPAHVGFGDEDEDKSTKTENTSEGQCADCKQPRK